MRHASYSCLTGLLLLGSGTLHGQGIELRPMQRDELWQRGVAASRTAVASPCSSDRWSYLQTLLYLFAWYQTARPTNPQEEGVFLSSFQNKVNWAQYCLSISDNSSSGSRNNASTPSSRRIATPVDNESFSGSQPQAAGAVQSDAQGRTIPQLLQLLSERDATIRQRDESIVSWQRNVEAMGRDLTALRARRAAGTEERAYQCAIENKGTGRMLAHTPQQGLHTLPKGQGAATFGIIPVDSGGRIIVVPATQVVLVAQPNSDQVGTLPFANDPAMAWVRFAFVLQPDGSFRIKHVSTNRWLQDPGGIITMTPSGGAPNESIGSFLLYCQ